MKLTLSYEKSLEQNASDYFGKAKAARQKIERVRETIASFQKKADKAKANEATEFTSSFKKIDHSKKRWFEKFKWSITSTGFLLIAGRDATTNEILVKKHVDADDIVFHTDMAGSPFVAIKKNSLQDMQSFFGPDVVVPDGIDDVTLQEAANFTAIHSKAWKKGLSATDVFWVTPEQVSKEANAGESLGRGSFMIRGKTTYIAVDLAFAVGLAQPKGQEAFFMSGPVTAVEHHCSSRVLVEQGKEKTSQVARLVRGKLRAETELDVEIDEIVRHLPSGGCQVKKERKKK